MELREALQNAGFHPGKIRLAAMMEKADEDHDGLISVTAPNTIILIGIQIPTSRHTHTHTHTHTHKQVLPIPDSHGLLTEPPSQEEEWMHLCQEVSKGHLHHPTATVKSSVTSK